MRTGRLAWVNQFAVGPTGSGGTRHAEIAQAMVPRGWQTTILASDFGLHARRYERRVDERDRRAIIDRLSDGVDLHWLWASPYARNDWRRARNWLSFARSVRAHGSALEADLVIGSSPQLFAAAGAERLARQLGVPFVFEVRDLWPESLLAAGARRGPFYWGLFALARFLYRRADRIVVLAEGSVDYLKSMGIPGDRIALVPNGVDVDVFDANAPTEAGGQTVFVYAGAHGPANGLDTVLGAAVRVRGRSDILFRLIGDGPSKSALRSEAERLCLSNVEFLPPVQKAQIPGALADAHAGLMVLRRAPLFEYGVSPNKLFDYMAARLPVVCNVPGEVARIVREGNAGVQAADESAEALAAAVTEMADAGPARRAEWGRSGRAWVERERSRPALASRLDSCLRELLQRR